MKIFAYAGSARGCNSQSLFAVQRVIDRLEEKKLVEDSLIATPQTHPIQYCKGCTKCSEIGSCVLDGTDSMTEMRKAMLEADLAIFASPVYVHNVSGYMKNFIDRLCLWCYTMPLMGKLVLTISISNTNGNSYVDSYLKKVFTAFGGGVFDQISFCTVLMTAEEMLNRVNQVCDEVESYVLQKEIYKISKLQSEYYINSKNMFKLLEEKSYIKEYWKQNGMFEYADAQSLFDEMAGWRKGCICYEDFESKKYQQGI